MGCAWHRNLDGFLMRNPDLSSKLMDIEDMVTVGRTHKVCPFFMSRALQHEADLVIMPYNYVLDPKLRRTMKDSIDHTEYHGDLTPRPPASRSPAGAS